METKYNFDSLVTYRAFNRLELALKFELGTFFFMLIVITVLRLFSIFQLPREIELLFVFYVGIPTVIWVVLQTIVVIICLLNYIFQTELGCLFDRPQSWRLTYSYRSYMKDLNQEVSIIKRGYNKAISTLVVQKFGNKILIIIQQANNYESNVLLESNLKILQEELSNTNKLYRVSGVEREDIYYIIEASK